MLRTPLLPFDDFHAWEADLTVPECPDEDETVFDAAVDADRANLRERLAVLLKRASVREAIYVASPSLWEEGLPYWQREPDSKEGLRAERALVRYLLRMVARATPFGLFAGSSIGRIGDVAEPTDLRLAPADRYGRHTRLDMDYLCALGEDLCGDPRLARELPLLPNTSLYRAGARVRYAEARHDEKGRIYQLVAVESTDYLEATIERASGNEGRGARVEDLARALVSDDPEIGFEEAVEFVEELVATQVLVPDLTPTVTGGGALEDLMHRLSAIESGRKPAHALQTASNCLNVLDDAGLTNSPRRYLELANHLRASLPTAVEPSRLVQVDMIKPLLSAVLGREVVEELVHGVDILWRLSPKPRSEGLENFRERMRERYGEGIALPLSEVLDEEIGIGFEQNNELGEASPLLAGLAIQADQRKEDGPSVPWGPREKFLIERFSRALMAGDQVIELNKGDLRSLTESLDAPSLQLPDAFQVMVEVASPDLASLNRGEFTLRWMNASGPSGARLLGRFCHLDSDLEARVLDHLRMEESHRPHTIFAEIVHLPQGRIGNILARPVLREYEIPYLGRASVLPEYRLPLTDLRVAIQGSRVVLTSERLGREVLPRLTTSHNFSASSLGVYRFLCSLQTQGVLGGLSWDWGPLASAPFLPRVQHGRLLIARAEWGLTRAEIEPLRKLSGATLLRCLRKLRRKRRLPRFVALIDGDNELLVDFENVIIVESFVELVKRRSAIRLAEFYPQPRDLWIEGPEGRFAGEILVPFVRRSGSHTEVKPLARISSLITFQDTDDSRTVGPQVPIQFPPGSDWLYVKLYTGTSTADRVLRELMAPLMRDLSGTYSHWFFIRYSDPDWHLRVRFCGEPKLLQYQVLPRLEAWAEPWLKDRRIFRFQIDTYQREVARYGGKAGIELAERLFAADSEAALTIIEKYKGDEGADARWRLALLGCDRLLCDFGLDLEHRLEVATRLRASWTDQFTPGVRLRKMVGARYREERHRIEAMFAAEASDPTRLGHGIIAFHNRSATLEPTVTEFRRREEAGTLTSGVEELALSFLHMHVNRMIRGAPRAHELVLYEFLYRYYKGRVGRENAGEKSR